MNRYSCHDRTILRHWKSLVIFTAGLLTGCQELGLPSPLSDRSQIETRHTLDTIFTPTPQNTPYLATLGMEAKKQLTNCQPTRECDSAHFIRALALLQENRVRALHHFQKVAVSSIDSPLARSSRVWIWILDETNPTNTSAVPRTNLTQGLIQALVTKDLALARQPQFHSPSEQKSQTPQNQIRYDIKIKALTEQVQGLAHDVASFSNQSSAIKSLRKELDARDKKVEVLSLQLDALRRIDQELKEKSTPTRLSDTIMPTKDERASTP